MTGQSRKTGVVFNISPLASGRLEITKEIKTNQIGAFYFIDWISDLCFNYFRPEEHEGKLSIAYVQVYCWDKNLFATAFSLSKKAFG